MHNRGQRACTIPIRMTAAAEQAKAEQKLQKRLTCSPRTRSFPLESCFAKVRISPAEEKHGLVFANRRRARQRESLKRAERFVIGDAATLLYGNRDEGGTETSRPLLLAREKPNALHAFGTSFSHVDRFDVSVFMNNNKRNAQ